MVGNIVSGFDRRALFVLRDGVYEKSLHRTLGFRKSYTDTDRSSYQPNRNTDTGSYTNTFFNTAESCCNYPGTHCSYTDTYSNTQFYTETDLNTK